MVTTLASIPPVIADLPTAHSLHPTELGWWLQEPPLRGSSDRGSGPAATEPQSRETLWVGARPIPPSKQSLVHSLRLALSFNGSSQDPGCPSFSFPLGGCHPCHHPWELWICCLQASNLYRILGDGRAEWFLLDHKKVFRHVLACTCAQNKAALKKGFVVLIERFSANIRQFFYKLWWGNTWLICHKLTGQKPCLRLTTSKASVLLSDNPSFDLQTNLVQLTFCSWAFWLKTLQSVCSLYSNHLLRFSRLKLKTCATVNVKAF